MLPSYARLAVSAAGTSYILAVLMGQTSTIILHTPYALSGTDLAPPPCAASGWFKTEKICSFFTYAAGRPPLSRAVL
eukprot:903137-Rhodomonas_salina.2